MKKTANVELSSESFTTIGMDMDSTVLKHNQTNKRNSAKGEPFQHHPKEVQHFCSKVN